LPLEFRVQLGIYMPGCLEDIEIERLDGGVGVIYLSRPNKHNAIRFQTLEDLDVAINDLEGDPSVRSLILTGRGDSFCSGADVGFLRETSKSEPLAIQDVVYSKAQGVAKRLFNFSKPTIAAINGAAITMGCEHMHSMRLFSTPYLISGEWGTH